MRVKEAACFDMAIRNVEAVGGTRDMIVKLIDLSNGTVSMIEAAQLVYEALIADDDKALSLLRASPGADDLTALSPNP